MLFLLPSVAICGRYVSFIWSIDMSFMLHDCIITVNFDITTLDDAMGDMPTLERLVPPDITKAKWRRKTRH